MIYLDTSFLVPFFLAEAVSASIEAFLRRQTPGELAISHLTRLEFTALLARESRMGRLDSSALRRGDEAFDTVVADSFAVFAPEVPDFDLARTFLRRYQSGLRAPDALHLAIAANQKVSAIYTLDAGMQKAGRMLGLPVRSGIRVT